jgi:hypothetical protein
VPGATDKKNKQVEERNPNCRRSLFPTYPGEWRNIFYINNLARWLVSNESQKLLTETCPTRTAKFEQTQ